MERQSQDHHSAKDFACPKYIICDCPEPHLSNAKRCRKVDADYTVEKLRQLVSDPVTSDHVVRISRLLCDYLREIGDEDIYQPIKHLPAVMKVLEFLAWKAREINDYRVHLDRMLHLCSRPPLLKRTSESLVTSVVMEHYFTLLGYLLTTMSNEEGIQKIHEALDCLLIGREKLANIAAVKLNFRRCAMENSNLPIIIVELLGAALPKIYPKILKMALVLASVSYQCCYRMLEAGILNTLLARMDLPYATQLRCTRPPEIPLEGEKYSQDTMLSITKLLWSLMRSVLPPQKLPDNLKNLPSPNQCAMWGLRYSFKRQILYSQHCAVSLRIRNDIAALILAGIVALPSWNLVGSGIVEDIVDLLPAIETGVVKIWTKQIQFSNSDGNLFFKRILLMIIVHLADIDICVFVMKKAMIIPIILRIIKYCMNKMDKEREGSLSLILLEHAMHILSLLAPRIETEFVKHKGTLVLLTMLDRVLNPEFDEYLTMIITRTICSIILQDNALLLENFRNFEMIPSLINLINNILDSDKLTMRRQRIITLLLVALEGLKKSVTSVQQTHGKRSVELVTKIFGQCLYQNKDYQVDQRLLLAIGSYIWQCITRCPTNLQVFLESGGIYSTLDIIEIASYPVRCLYLGTLVDICDCTFCGQCLCTWRGTNKETGLMSLLATVWREEEDRIGIKRRADGSIADPELPQMGTKQWTDTYRSQLTADASPTMADMFGSVRSKIFSILKIIERDGDRYEIARKHYKILLDGLSTEDRVTLCCADMYLRLKLGQMWTELMRYLEQVGITPLSVDAHLIAHMVQWHRSWGILIEERQRKLVAAAKRTDEILEKDELARIRDANLAPALEALDEMDRIRRTADRSYMLRKKDRQRRQVRAALSFPRDADAERCHRTFSDEANVTVILGQHKSIDSSHLGHCTYGLADLPLISSSDSPHEQIFPSLDTVSSNSSFHKRQFTDEYFFENLNR